MRFERLVTHKVFVETGITPISQRKEATKIEPTGPEPLLILRIHHDEGIDGTGQPSGHTAYTTRQIPAWAQYKKSRHNFVLMIVVAGIQLFSTPDSQLKALPLPGLDRLASCIFRVDNAYLLAGHEPSNTIDAENMALSRELNAMIEADAAPPSRATHLVDAWSTAPPVQPNVDALIELYNMQGRKWVANQRLVGPHAQEDLLQLWEGIRRDLLWIQNLTPRKVNALCGYVKTRIGKVF